MSSDIQPYILDELDTVIDQTVADIGLYTKNPGDFTRNRKLNATTTIKVTLNMQSNSLNAELLDAFPNLDERMTASAYIRKGLVISANIKGSLVILWVALFITAKANAEQQGICYNKVIKTTPLPQKKLMT